MIIYNCVRLMSLERNGGDVGREGIWGLFYYIKDLGRGKRLEIAVKVVVASEFSDYFSGKGIGGVAGNWGNLFCEGFSKVEVGTFLLKEMVWLDGGELFMPERDLRRDQNLEGFVLWSDLERVSCHFLLGCWLTIEEIWLLRIWIWGSWGLVSRRESRCWIRDF